MMFLLGLLLAMAQIISAEITVLKSNQIVYDKSPKLRIRGTGFDAQDHDILLEISANGSPALLVDKDYLVSKDADGDGLILKTPPNPPPVTIEQLKPTGKPAASTIPTSSKKAKKATTSKAAAAPAEPIRHQNTRSHQQNTAQLFQPSLQPPTKSENMKYTAEEQAASSLQAAKAIERALAAVGIPYEASLSAKVSLSALPPQQQQKQQPQQPASQPQQAQPQPQLPHKQQQPLPEDPPAETTSERSTTAPPTATTTTTAPATSTSKEDTCSDSSKAPPRSIPIQGWREALLREPPTSHPKKKPVAPPPKQRNASPSDKGSSNESQHTGPPSMNPEARPFHPRRRRRHHYKNHQRQPPMEQDNEQYPHVQPPVAPIDSMIQLLVLARSIFWHQLPPQRGDFYQPPPPPYPFQHYMY